MKTMGLNTLTNELGQLSKAIADLDGDLTQVSFDPSDPASIERAVQQMEAAVDERVARYGSSKAVMAVVSQVKGTFREAILAKASRARLEASVQGEG